MEMTRAVAGLAALGNETRLRVFRLLVRAGPDGMAAGRVAERLGVPKPTLSFHLRHLEQAGLVQGRRRGRCLRYSVHGGTTRQLLGYLGADCCQARRDLCAPLGRLPRRTAGDRDAVLFVCTRNSARSQMAEALLRRRAGDRFAVYSAGMRPEPVHPLTLRVLQEIGLETSGLRAKDIGELLGKKRFDQAIVVCRQANRDCPGIHPFADKRLYWPIEDPAVDEGPEAGMLARFRAARDEIDARIVAWLEERVRGTA